MSSPFVAVLCSFFSRPWKLFCPLCNLKAVVSPRPLNVHDGAYLLFINSSTRGNKKNKPAYELFCMRLFPSAQPYTLYWRQPLLPCTGLLGHKTNVSVWKDREEVRIFTLRSVARSLCSAQRPEGKRVFLGCLGLFGPYYTAQALGSCFGCGTLLRRAAPAEGHELEPDNCQGDTYTVWDTKGLMSMDI